MHISSANLINQMYISDEVQKYFKNVSKIGLRNGNKYNDTSSDIPLDH